MKVSPQLKVVAKRLVKCAQILDGYNFFLKTYKYDINF